MQLSSAIVTAFGVLYLGASSTSAAQVTPSAPPPAQYRVTMQRLGSEVVIEVGPLDIPAGGDAIVPGSPSTRVLIPVDGWFRGYRTEIVDESGARVPGELVVVNVLSVSERELFSPIALRLATIAPGVPSASLPRILGYRATAGDTLLVSAQFRRSNGRAWNGVRARIRFAYDAKGSFVGTLRIQPFSLEVMPPGGPKTFDLPVGLSERWWEGRPATGGRVLGFGGYVQKYAVSIRLEDRTSNKVIWQHRVDTTESGAVKGIPVKRFLRTFGTGLDTAHTYRLTVAYDNRTASAIRNGGAGAIGGIFLVGDGGRWPRVDTTNPLYLSDLLAMSK